MTSNVLNNTDPVLFEIDGRGVATITLNRPERLNAMNMAVRDLLWTYLEACRDTPGVRVIVFRGEACGAGVVAEFGTAPSIIEPGGRGDVWGLLLDHRCVTIARMHGYTSGRAGLPCVATCGLRRRQRSPPR
jgi:enoyl-CoA hydratase/carnithine racemase